jgi:predicted ATP-dependent endonuclease of OLD family
MQIEKIEIENFRSITKRLYLNPCVNRMHVLFGRNSSGKSNILRAINLLFNERVEENLEYSWIRDSSIGSDKKTTIILVQLRLCDKQDSYVKKYIKGKENDLMGDSDVITVHLQISSTGNFQYRLRSTSGKLVKNDEVIQVIKNAVNCVYIPSIKDYKKILYVDLMRKIVSNTFQGWGLGIVESKRRGEQKERFKVLLSQIQGILDDSGNIVDEELSRAWDKIEKFKFVLPSDQLEDFLGSLEFQIKEKDLNEVINLADVGSGIQCFMILSILKLLHDTRHKGQYYNGTFLWLIEEPETFMHHDLQRKTRDRLLEFAKSGNIVITTHSPVFANKALYSSCYQIESNGGTTARTVKAKDIVAAVAGTLGITLSDYLDIGSWNILVEGESDVAILEAAVGKLREIVEGFVWDENEIKIINCKSASGIPHFWYMYRPFAEYANFICLFDRDESGQKARAELVNNGVSSEAAIFVPDISHNRSKPALEDVIDREEWIQMVEHLDAKGLVTVHKKQNRITNYEYEERNRREVKQAISDFVSNGIRLSSSGYMPILGLVEGLAKKCNQQASVHGRLGGRR